MSVGESLNYATQGEKTYPLWVEFLLGFWLVYIHHFLPFFIVNVM